MIFFFVRTKVAEKNCVSLPIYAESAETQKSGAVISAQNFDITNSGRGDPSADESGGGGNGRRGGAKGASLWGGGLESHLPHHDECSYSI